MISTDEGLIKISEAKRGCRFNSEHNGENSIFKNYSQSSCLFECQMKKAFMGSNAPKCLPWDFPHAEEPLSVCNGWTFDYLASTPYETTPTDNCDCPVDCNIHGYSFTWNWEPMEGVSEKQATTILKRENKAFLYEHFSYATSSWRIHGSRYFCSCTKVESGTINMSFRTNVERDMTNYSPGTV